MAAVVKLSPPPPRVAAVERDLLFLLALNSLLVFIDIILLPAVDLLPLRLATNLLAVGVLLYGFVWDSE